MKAILRRIELLIKTLIKEVGLLRELLELLRQPTPPVADEWIRADEVMRILSISQRTLYNYTKTGVFVTKRIGGTTFYCKASVMRLK